MVGERAATVVDWLITIGERAQTIAAEARRAGLSAHSIESVESNSVAVSLLRRKLRRGDFLLIKGSHAMRLDEVVNAIRATA